MPSLVGEQQVLCASWNAVNWVLWKCLAMAAFLVLQPGAWIPAVNARQNQAINEMYVLGLHAQLWVKAKTVLCLALSTHIWP
jgi:hypothetical protein